jgi:hypothetical protein
MTYRRLVSQQFQQFRCFDSHYRFESGRIVRNPRGRMELREVCAGLLGSSELVRFNCADPEIGRGYAGKVEFREVFEHHGRLNLNHIRLAQDTSQFGNQAVGQLGIVIHGIRSRRHLHERLLGNAAGHGFAFGDAFDGCQHALSHFWLVRAHSELQLFRAVGAPEWHGRNFDALRDSIATGSINAVEVPYRLVIQNYDKIALSARQMADGFVDLIRELAAEGCPIEIRAEGQ